MKQNFVGFPDSDKFLAAVDRERPVNLSITRKPGRPDRRYGIALDATVLTLSQVQGNEVIYFAHATHRYQVFNGEIFGSDKEKPGRLADQVEQAVKRYLTDHGIAWRDAMVAMPINYTILDGSATFLKWDTKAESYSYVQAQPRAEIEGVE